MRSAGTAKRGLVAAIAAFGVLAIAPAAEASTTLYGITSKGELAKFDSKKPGKVKKNKLKGLGDGVKLVGIDQRPETGKLFGIGDDSKVYSLTNKGKATAIDDSLLGTGFAGMLGATALDGSSFAVDFNPVPDAIRIVSNTGQNLRVSPDTGQLIAEDGDINGADASIIGAAYTNSGISMTPPATATLYVLDTKMDRFYTQNPPNDGTLTSPVKLSKEISGKAGFDLLGAGTKGFVVDGKGKKSKLFQVKGELNAGLSGTLKPLGKVKAKLTGIAAVQKPAK